MEKTQNNQYLKKKKIKPWTTKKHIKKNTLNSYTGKLDKAP